MTILSRFSGTPAGVRIHLSIRTPGGRPEYGLDPGRMSVIRTGMKNPAGCAAAAPSPSFTVIRNPAWFEDAELEPDPVVLNGQTWIAVKDSARGAAARF